MENGELLENQILAQVALIKKHVPLPLRDLIQIEEGIKANDDEFYMRRCVELAKRAIGCTSPNPMIGCVIVKDGEIVGEGFHPKAGQPHAEDIGV